MKAVFSILKSFLALCGLAALSTALSADSRLSPVGAASAGAAGFLYSDYLQTAASSGRSPELQGSFVVKNHRPFLADIGGQLPGRIVDEIKTLPLKEWGLGYVFEDRRPAHQSALAERGWRIADWLAEETLMAATESSRGGGFIRTLEFDLQSELGGRRGSAGLNVLGALRETADYDALAWQLRGFKTKDGGGGSAGLIYRWLPDETALVGVNAFADYETNNGNGFWRWSAGAEVRTAWADLFGNYYQGITDDKRRGDEWIYTADGYDVELNVHSPDLPWLVGEITYFNWKGRHGDDDDRGFRFGVKVKPATGVEVALEYEKRNSDSDTDDGDNKKEWSGWVRYSGNLGEPARRLRSGGEYNNYEPRDYFFSPAEREYSQRIRKAKGAAGGSSNSRVRFALAALQSPIIVRGTDLSLTISNVNSEARVQGTDSGQQISDVISAANDVFSYPLPASTVTLSHAKGTLTLTFRRTGATVVIESDVAMATEGAYDYFALLDGKADIMLGGGSGMFVAEQRVTANNPNNDDYRRITVSASPASPMTLALTVSASASSMADKLPAPKLRPEDNLRVEQKIGSAPPVNFTVSNPRGNVVLADDSFLVAGTPPMYYRASGGVDVIVATLNSEGGVGNRQWSRESGQLNVDRNGVVSIPSSQSPQNSGVNLELQAVLSDGFDNNGNSDSSLTDIASQTENYTLAFTVNYRRIASLAANFNTAGRDVYGLADSNAEIVVATITAAGNQGVFTYAKTGGQLDVRSVGSNGEFGHVVIPAHISPSAAPGNKLVLEAELSQPIPGGSTTRTIAFSLTVNYIAVSGVVLNLNRGGSPISDLVRIYGVENVSRTEKIADIMAGGGSGNVVASLRVTGANPTTPSAFAIAGNNVLNLSRTFPAFNINNSEDVTAVVVANDSGEGAAAVTPQIEKRVTVRLLPVRDKLMPGGNVDKAARNPNNVVSPTSPNATEGEFTVYVLEGQKEAGVIARVSPASAADNAAVEGLSGLQVNAPTRHSSSADTGLQFEQDGNDTNVRIVNGTTPTPSGVDLKLVLEYNDSGHPVSELTDSLLKTVSVHYETVEPFAPEVRNAAGNAVLTDPATIYAAQSDNTEKMAAKLVKVGGAAGDMRVISYSPRNNLEVKDNGDVFVRANTTKGLSPFVVNVVLNDAETAEGSVTPQVEVRLTVVYEETRDVQASFADITGNNHFLGAADSSSGVRTLYFKASANRSPQLDILRINAQSGTSQYTFNTNSPFGLDGFALTGSGNNRVLALLAAKADGAMARATVEIDDSGDGSDISDPATLTALVAVKHVEAIEAKFVDSENSNSELTGLQVMSADSQNSASLNIANVSALKGSGDFQYTRENGSSAGLSVDNNGMVWLVANYEPNGQNTLTIIVKVEDQGDGSTLTEAATITLEFVLAKTIGAEVLLRNNGGAYVPSGTSGNDVAVGSQTRTVKVKTAEYGNEQVVFGVRPSGGLGASPAFAIARTGSENGLVARGQQNNGQRDYALEVAVKSGASAPPKTFGITAIVNESTSDPNNLTPGATISVTVVYDTVDPIAGAFQETDGTPIVGRHVVATTQASSSNLVVAKIAPSGGVGSEGGGFRYTFRLEGNAGDLLVDAANGNIMVRGGVNPAIDFNIAATVVVDDEGDWAHVSEPKTIEVTVLYSSKVQLEAAIAETRTNAPLQVITPNRNPPQTVYFPSGAGRKPGRCLRN